MSMTAFVLPASRRRQLLNWVSQAPWLLFILSTFLSLIITLFIFYWVLDPPMTDMTSMLRTLTISSVASLGLGFFLYRQGLMHSPSLSLTLIMTYIWAAASTLFNVWVMPQFMFANRHDFWLAMVLLVFAGIIATCFGIFVSATVTTGLHQLACTAQEVAAGNFAVRVPVSGRDEVAQAAQAFNQMAEQLERAAQQRAEVEAMRRDLIAWVSHDLRTPLTSIRAIVEALNDDLVTAEDTPRYYKTILHDVMSLNHLIDDLFELAQLDAGLQLEMTTQSLSDLISDTLERFCPLGRVKGIEVAGNVDPDVDPVTFNTPKIERVLSNLLSNAIRHTPSGGQIQVSAHRFAGNIHVTIQDTGSGFVEADLPRIFEKFYRGEEARSRATGGAGLGLAIAHSIIQAHGGKIWAENNSQQGATVTFTLPA